MPSGLQMQHVQQKCSCVPPWNYISHFLLAIMRKAKKETEMFSVKNSAVCKMVANQAGADHHSNNDALIIEMPNMAYG